MLKEDHLQEKYYVMLHFVMLKMITSKKRYHVVLQYNIMSKMITFKKYIMLCYIISPWRWSPSRKILCNLTLCSVEDDHLQERCDVMLEMIIFKKKSPSSASVLWRHKLRRTQDLQMKKKKMVSDMSFFLSSEWNTKLHLCSVVAGCTGKVILPSTILALGGLSSEFRWDPSLRP